MPRNRAVPAVGLARAAKGPAASSIGREGEGDLLARARVALGLSARQLAAAFGTDQRTITRWEAGEYRLPRVAWVALYFVLRNADADTGLINALPVPSRKLCPLVERPADAGADA